MSSSAPKSSVAGQRSQAPTATAHQHQAQNQPEHVQKFTYAVRQSVSTCIRADGRMTVSQIKAMAPRKGAPGVSFFGTVNAHLPPTRLSGRAQGCMSKYLMVTDGENSLPVQIIYDETCGYMSRHMKAESLIGHDLVFINAEVDELQGYAVQKWLPHLQCLPNPNSQNSVSQQDKKVCDYVARINVSRCASHMLIKNSSNTALAEKFIKCNELRNKKDATEDEVLALPKHIQSLCDDFIDSPTQLLNSPFVVRLDTEYTEIPYSFMSIKFLDDLAEMLATKPVQDGVWNILFKKPEAMVPLADIDGHMGWIEDCSATRMPIFINGEGRESGPIGPDPLCEIGVDCGKEWGTWYLCQGYPFSHPKYGLGLEIYRPHLHKSPHASPDIIKKILGSVPPEKYHLEPDTRANCTQNCRQTSVEEAHLVQGPAIVQLHGRAAAVGFKKYGKAGDYYNNNNTKPIYTCIAPNDYNKTPSQPQFFCPSVYLCTDDPTDTPPSIVLSAKARHFAMSRMARLTYRMGLIQCSYIHKASSPSQRDGLARSYVNKMLLKPGTFTLKVSFSQNTYGKNGNRYYEWEILHFLEDPQPDQENTE